MMTEDSGVCCYDMAETDTVKVAMEIIKKEGICPAVDSTLLQMLLQLMLLINNEIAIDLQHFRI